MEGLTGYAPFDNILKKTKNVVLFQEQYMQVLNEIFGFDLKYANDVRKILSKKKKDQLLVLEPEIREAGKKNNVPDHVVDFFWKSALASADYSFCLCLAGSNVIRRLSEELEIEDSFVCNVEIGDKLLAYNEESQNFNFVKVRNIDTKNNISLYRYFFSDGTFLTCSKKHRVFSSVGMLAIEDSFVKGFHVFNNKGLYVKIVKREKGGESICYDFTVDSEFHNFFCNGVLVSNSHAASYSVLAAQMVYLKFKYPQSFYLHALKEAVTKPKPFDEIFEITQELPNFDIKLLPPDIDKSGLSFEKEGDDIRFGLGDIKGISSKSLENLKKFIKEDKKHKFAVFQAGKNAGINIGQMTALIYVGALDSVSFGTERRMLALECAGWYQLKEGEQAWLLNHGEKYNYSFKEAYLDIDNWVGSNGKKVARATRNNTISKGLETYRQIYLANKNNKRFAHWKFERDLLGYSYSFRLKDVFETGEVINDVKFAVSQFEGDNSSILGEVQEVKKFTSRNGNTCLKLVVCDELAKIQAMLVGDAEYESFKEQGLIPKAGDIIVLHGKKGTDDMIWIDKMSIQDVHVVFKKSDLTKQLNKETV